MMRGHEAEIMELQALMKVRRGEMARMRARMLYDWIRLLLNLLVVVRDVRRFLLGRIIPVRIRSTEILGVIIWHMLLVLLLIHRLQGRGGVVELK